VGDRVRSTPPGFWAVWTAVAVDLLGFGILIPLLPLYADRFGAGPAVIGLLFASYSLAQFVFSPIWGRISDRVGRRPIMLLTIAGSAIGSLVLGLAGSVAALFVGRIVDGVSGASVAVARATVADTADLRQRPRLMGLLGAAFGLGFVIGPAVGGLAALGGPEIPFFVAAGISTVNFAVAAIRLPETRPPVADRATEPRAGRLPAPVIRLVVLTFCAIAAFSAFETTFALLANGRLGLTEPAVAGLFAGVGVVLVVVQGGVVGLLANRIGEPATIRIGLLANVVGLVVIARAGTLAALTTGLVALAAGQGLVTPTLSSAVAGFVPPGRSGTALGIQQSAGGLARVVGPALGGALFGFSVPAPFLAAAGLTLAVLPLVPAPPPVIESLARPRN
jgi:MFS transporter, DHA1 family, tetracycline resistance protein